MSTLDIITNSSSVTINQVTTVDNIEEHSNSIFTNININQEIKQSFNSVNTRIRSKKSSTIITQNSKITIRKYFSLWKNYVKFKKDRTNQLKKQIEIKEKLDSFLKAIKKHQNRNVNHENKATQSQKISKQVNNFENRFKAQQKIIKVQKEKLIQQKKIIERLKLNKISEAIDDSMEEAKLNVRETLTNCSTRVKCKATMLTSIEDTLSKFYVQSCEAPKILQQMEKRAFERQQRRQIILERKRKIDNAKKQALEREIENKRLQDEEERKRNLLEIRERQKIELEIQKQRQIKKRKFLENCEKADRFFKQKLKKFAFNKLTTLVTIKNENIHKSEEFYKISLQRKSLNSWKIFLFQINFAKNNKAIDLYNFKLKREMFSLWYQAHTINIQNKQVAQDVYEMNLQRKMFKWWHRCICIKLLIMHQNMNKAQKHYNGHILLHYFYQWKSLSVINQLERAREEKKRKWREKVWEILPDYQPQIEEY